jgi:hypothetical protein
LVGATADNYFAIACSADGKRLVAASQEIGGESGVIYLSTNTGHSWQNMNAPQAVWTSVTSSGDGRKLAAVVNGGGIYTWQSASPPPAPSIASIALAGNNVVLTASNGAAGVTYVLMSSTNLAQGGWVPVATNALGASGSFSITAGAVNPDVSRQFFRIRAQ